MAHRTSHRRTLASPDVNPPAPPTSTTTAAAKSSHHPTTKTLYPNMAPSYQTKPYKVSTHFSRSEKSTNPDYATKDIHMQAKSMTLSADSGSIIKPKFRLPHNRATKPTKGEKLPKKEASLEKRSLDELDSKKQEKQPVGLKKKDPFIVTAKEIEGKDLEASRVSVGLVGRRRSLDGSRVELGDILANCGVRVVSVDMPPFMQIHAVDFARKIHDSLEKYSSKTLALSLKKEFDGVYGPAWHCIVGTSFGSFVTHSVGGFLYFSMDQKLYILLFKTTVQRAD